MKKKNILITVLPVAVLVIVVVALVASGRLVWTDGGMNSVAAKPVCGGNIVDKYNDAMFMIKREGAEMPSIDEAGVKQVETSVKEAKGYEDDATCQTLLFWTAMYHGDYESAKSAHERVKSLHAQNKFANSNIRGNQPLLSYEQLLKGISVDEEVGPGAL